MPRAATLWAIDLHSHEFFVPTLLYPLSEDNARGIEAVSDYSVDKNGGFAYYHGPERYAAAFLPPTVLMEWAAAYVARRSESLAKRLTADSDANSYDRAIAQLNRVASHDCSDESYYYGTASSPLPTSAHHSLPA